MHWWGWLSIPFTRCQNKPLKEQKTARCADIRLRYEHNQWYVCHGKTIFCTFEEGMEIIKDSAIWKVRVLFEEQLDVAPEVYNNLYERLKEDYSDYRFYEGRRKTDWEQLIPLESIPDLVQHVGSMSGTLIGKISPYLYWLLIGKRKYPDWVMELVSGKSNNMAFDFVD